MLDINPMLLIDSYKLGHMTMYPESTQNIYCNFTPRSDKYFKRTAVKGIEAKIVAYGQRLAMQEIHDEFSMNFFNRPQREVLNEVRAGIKTFVAPEDEELVMEKVKRLHAQGFLPLKVKWLDEGTVINPGIPVLTAQSTLPEFHWLPGFLEDFFSSEIWKRSTAASTARHYKKIVQKFSKETCDDDLHIPFQCHDFSCRGMATMEDAVKTGTGHLTQFLGTDTVGAAALIDKNYLTTEMIGCSVPATEHSVMVVNQAVTESEEETFRRLLKKYPSGIVSIVADTYDYWHTIKNISLSLKDDIEARVPNAYGLCKTVFRPDSGNPVDVICGKMILPSLDVEECGFTNTKLHEIDEDSYVILVDGKYYAVSFYGDSDDYIEEIEINDGETISEEEVKGSIEILWNNFGGTENNKGFKVLNPKVGLIYGDSITPQRAYDILARLKAKGFASSNVVFGVGSFTYNYVTRDTLGYAFKATYTVIDGNGYAIAKTPKTDTGKTSAKGLLKVSIKNSEYVLEQDVSPIDEESGELHVGYINGEFVEELPSWKDIRTRAQ